MPFLVINRHRTSPRTTFEDEVLLYSPDSYWPLSQVSKSANAMLDLGSDANHATMGTYQSHVAFPGPFVGNPGGATYGIGFADAISSPASTCRTIDALAGAMTATSGTVCGWIRAGYSTSHMYPLFAQRYAANGGFYLQMDLFYSSGWKLRMRVAGNGANLVTCTSPADSIIPGQWHFVAAVQPADGTGIQLYIDGSPVTTTRVNGGTATNNSWCAYVGGIAGSVDAEAYLGDKIAAGSYGTSGLCGVGWWNNVALTADDILGLYNNTVGYLATEGSTYARADSFHDQVRKHADPLVWLPMKAGDYTQITNCRPINYGKTGVNTTSSLFGTYSGFSSPGDQATGPCINTSIDLDDYCLTWSSNRTIAVPATNISALSTQTTGTISAFIKPSSVAAGKHTFYGFGQTVNVCMVMELNADKFRWRVQTAAGANLYQVEVNAVSFSTGTWYMVTVQQTGSAIKMFINGVEYTGGDLTVTTAGTGIDATSWYNTMTTIVGSENHRWGGAVGSATSDVYSGDYAHWWFSEAQLTADQLLDIYNAART